MDNQYPQGGGDVEIKTQLECRNQGIHKMTLLLDNEELMDFAQHELRMELSNLQHYQQEQLDEDTRYSQLQLAYNQDRVYFLRKFSQDFGDILRGVQQHRELPELKIMEPEKENINSNILQQQCKELQDFAVNRQNEDEVALQNYGRLEKTKRHRMLHLSKQKAKMEGDYGFGNELSIKFEEFTGKKIKNYVGNFDLLCWEIVDRIPENKWMKFVRLHLNFTEVEIQAFCRQHRVLTIRQKAELLRGIGSRDQNIWPPITHYQEPGQSQGLTLRQNYGRLNRNRRLGMLLLSEDKAEAKGIYGFEDYLRRKFKDFTGKTLKLSLSKSGVCREIVDRIPENKWMRFVRLHLNLTEAELQLYRRQHCAFTKRQKIAV